MLLDKLFATVCYLINGLVYAVGALPWPPTPTFMTSAFATVSGWVGFFLSVLGAPTHAAVISAVTLLALLVLIVWPLMRTKVWFVTFADAALRLLGRR